MAQHVPCHLPGASVWNQIFNEVIECLLDSRIGPFPARQIEQHGGFGERLLCGKIALRQVRSAKAVCAQEPDCPLGDPKSQAQMF
jgi:hypothetical protein